MNAGLLLVLAGTVGAVIAAPDAALAASPGAPLRLSVADASLGDTTALAEAFGESLLPSAIHAPQDAEPLSQELSAASPTSFGRKDSCQLNYLIGGGFDVAEDAQHAQVGVSWSYFIEDNLSLDLELNGLFVAQSVGDNALGANFNLLFRWHFVAEPNWSLYFDGGAGVLVTTEEVPGFMGSNFNFTPQAGFGASWDIGDDRRILAGARWHHISNANLFDENAGRDSIMIYAMISVPF